MFSLGVKHENLDPECNIIILMNILHSYINNDWDLLVIIKTEIEIYQFFSPVTMQDLFCTTTFYTETKMLWGVIVFQNNSSGGNVTASAVRNESANREIKLIIHETFIAFLYILWCLNRSPYSFFSGSYFCEFYL